MALRSDSGARITPDGDPFTFLFSESAGRALVVTTQPDDVAALARTHGVPCASIGVAGVGDALVLEGLFEVPLAELRERSTATLPAALA